MRQVCSCIVVSKLYIGVVDNTNNKIMRKWEKRSLVLYEVHISEFIIPSAVLDFIMC